MPPRKTTTKPAKAQKAPTPQTSQEAAPAKAPPPQKETPRSDASSEPTTTSSRSKPLTVEDIARVAQGVTDEATTRKPAASRGKYPSYRDFIGDPEAEAINNILNAFDPDGGAASRCNVGESWMALRTMYWNKDLHPGYILMWNAACYAFIIYINRGGKVLGITRDIVTPNAPDKKEDSPLGSLARESGI